MTRVVWSPRALVDLDDIEAYIAKDHPAAARRLVRKIVERTKRIEMFPLSGGLVEEDDRQRYRQVIQGKYRVIYRYEPAANTAFVNSRGTAAGSRAIMKLRPFAFAAGRQLPCNPVES